MKFFPADPGAWAALAELLAKICPHREALEWLVTTLQNRVAEWPGAHAIRGLLCTRYEPDDGIDEYCTIPGFRPEDCEARHYEQHQALQSGGYELPPEWKQLAAARRFPAAEPIPLAEPPKRPPASIFEHQPKFPTEAELEALRREAGDESLSAEAREIAARLFAKFKREDFKHA
jgi:hypothetical protein